jgi:hypothetical protein
MSAPGVQARETALYGLADGQAADLDLPTRKQPRPYRKHRFQSNEAPNGPYENYHFK